MMTAYISVSIRNRKLVDAELSAICSTLRKYKIEPYIFVDHNKFDASQERQMMQQAMTDIDRCDIVIAETSDKGIGIGIEVGYAKARNKPIIYIRKKQAKHSTTVSGMSDFQIIYNDTNELQKQLSAILENMKRN